MFKVECGLDKVIGGAKVRVGSGVTAEVIIRRDNWRGWGRWGCSCCRFRVSRSDERPTRDGQGVCLPRQVPHSHNANVDVVLVQILEEVAVEPR